MPWWAPWVAIAAIAGIVTFILLRRPEETGPLSLTPVVVASTRAPEEAQTPEAIEPEVAVEPPVEDVVEVSPMVSSMTSRMSSVMRSPMTSVMTQAPTMTVAAAVEAPERSPTSMPTMRTMAGSADLPETPSRDEVQSALLAVRGSVRECMSRGGRVPVRVSVSGRTGRVTTATVQDPYFARQPTGGCIARAVRRARFPRFQQERLVIVYPYEF